MIGAGPDRRAVLAGLAALFAAPALPRLAAAEEAAAVLARTGLGPLSGFALADAATGEILEAHLPAVPRTPASVAKVVTALYALDALGPGFRFRTQLVATGPIAEGRLDGDLVLVGGGDPLLDTDALGDLAAALAEQVESVAGRFLIAGGALPQIEQVDEGQPPQAAYNPAVSGLNLNFNRVFLEWEPGPSGPALGLGAPGQRFNAPVPEIVAELGEARRFSHVWQSGRELWTVPRARLRGRGGVWLPVRAPDGYAGRVFRSLAADAGVELPELETVDVAPGGTVLAEHASAPLEDVLRGMLRYSTNLTAEVAGLRASVARGEAPEDLAQSAAAMTGWARDRYGLEQAVLLNHSGLTGGSAISPAEMVKLLVAETDRLPPLLRERPILDARGQLLRGNDAWVNAKTGTLDFTTALAGYMEIRDARFAFAIFAGDAEARAAIPPEARDDPPGSSGWIARARAQEHALLRAWATAQEAELPLRPRARPG